MTSRRYGDSGASSLDTMLAHAAIMRIGEVRREQVINARRLFLVLFPNAAEVPVYCEACNVSEYDKTQLVGQRVLVAQLGDGRGVIIGTLGRADPSLSAEPMQEEEPDSGRDSSIGADDRVFEWKGSRIIFTASGDIIFRPKRALRMQTSLFRVEVEGDASDNPVAARPFLEWAGQVDTMLERHEGWILANGSLSGIHTHVPPTLPAAAPDIAQLDVAPPGVKMPTGGE